MTHDESGSYSTPMKRIKKAGFNPKACAENVAYNQKTIEKVMESWMNSSGTYIKKKKKIYIYIYIYIYLFI